MKRTQERWNQSKEDCQTIGLSGCVQFEGEDLSKHNQHTKAELAIYKTNNANGLTTKALRSAIGKTNYEIRKISLQL